MPITVGQCPVPWPNLNNKQRIKKGDIPEDIKRLQCDPFVRLTCIPTKSYIAKKTGNPCAPKDHLDIALSACYDHHRQWWAPRAQTVMQCATYALFPWGRAQQRVCRLKSLGTCPSSMEDPLMVNHEPYRNDISHIDSSIGSPHISNTNRGYARSTIDGLFYNC